MQNNRNRSDFADAHTDLSADAVMPLKYLIMKNYRHVYLYIYRLAKAEARARVCRPQASSSPPVISLLSVPRGLFCFGFLVILDVVHCYLWLFLLYINMKIGKNSC